MDAAQLRNAVDLLGGADHVFAFGYDNAGRVFFDSKRPFSLDMIQGEFLKMTTEALDGQTVTELKPIETIQSIVGVQDPKERDEIDKHYFRS